MRLGYIRNGLVDKTTLKRLTILGIILSGFIISSESFAWMGDCPENTNPLSQETAMNSTPLSMQIEKQDYSSNQDIVLTVMFKNLSPNPVVIVLPGTISYTHIFPIELFELTDLKTGKLWKIGYFGPLGEIMDRPHPIPASETVAFEIKYLGFNNGKDKDWIVGLLPPGQYRLTTFYKAENAYCDPKDPKLSLQATLEFTVRD